MIVLIDNSKLTLHCKLQTTKRNFSLFQEPFSFLEKQKKNREKETIENRKREQIYK